VELIHCWRLIRICFTILIIIIEDHPVGTINELKPFSLFLLFWCLKRLSFPRWLCIIAPFCLLLIYLRCFSTTLPTVLTF
jgi:hypothetical protein